MAQFVGLWKLDNNSYENFDEFAEVSGLPAEMQEKYKNTKITMEFSRNGDEWTYIMKYDNTDMPDKTYVFRSGEEVVSESMGKGVKFTITFESDSKLKMIEHSEMMGWKPIINTREIREDTMYITNEIEGVKMHLKLTRC